jgi:hypothetical protein
LGVYENAAKSMLYLPKEASMLLEEAWVDGRIYRMLARLVIMDASPIEKLYKNTLTLISILENKIAVLHKLN